VTDEILDDCEGTPSLSRSCDGLVRKRLNLQVEQRGSAARKLEVWPAEDVFLPDASELITETLLVVEERKLPSTSAALLGRFRGQIKHASDIRGKLVLLAEEEFHEISNDLLDIWRS